MQIIEQTGYKVTTICAGGCGTKDLAYVSSMPDSSFCPPGWTRQQEANSGTGLGGFTYFLCPRCTKHAKVGDMVLVGAGQYLLLQHLESARGWLGARAEVRGWVVHFLGDEVIP